MAVPTPTDERKGMYVKDTETVVKALDLAAERAGRTRASYLRLIIRQNLVQKGLLPESERYAADDADDEGAN